MKRLAFLASMLLMTGLMLTSCKPERIEEEAGFDAAQLRAGTWTIDYVANNNFDGQGNLINSEITQFGEGEVGGICTFHYGEDGVWVLNDNGTEFSSGYRLDGRVIYTDDGGQWGLREMTDTYMEVVQRGTELNNPCAYNVQGAVYYLTREDR